MRVLFSTIFFLFLAAIGVSQPISSVRFPMSEVTGGSMVRGVVTLTGNAALGGKTIPLSSNSANAIVPPDVFIPEGSSSVEFYVRTVRLDVAQVATITATDQQGGAARNALISVEPIDLADYYVVARYSSDGVARIVRVDLANSQMTTLLPSDGGDNAPHDSFTRQPGQLPFAQYPWTNVLITYHRATEGVFQVWLTDLEGSFHRQLTFSGSNYGGGFSPDGQKILYNHSQGGQTSIEAYDLVTDEITTLVSEQMANVGGGDWVPDGNGLIYDAIGSALRWKKSDGSVSTISTGSGFGLPKVSPDGLRSAFLRVDEGVARVQEIRMSDGAPTSNSVYWFVGHCYAPDGSILIPSGGAVKRFLPWSNTNYDLLPSGSYDGITLVRKPYPNTAPVVTNDEYQAVEDTSLDQPAPGVLANDYDPDLNDSITATLETGPQHAAEFSLNADGSFHYRPAPNFHGQDTFTYRAQDNWGALSGAAVVTIQVTSVNDAPILNPIGNRTVNEQTLLTFTASAADPDVPANTLVYTLESAPPGASIGIFSGVFQWTPTEAQGPGDYTFTVRVTDNGDPNLSDEETITVHVDEANRPPVLAGIGNRTVAEGSDLTFTANATDPDLPAQNLSYSLIGAPSGASIHPSSGVFHWTPSESQGPGGFTLTVRVTDSGSPAQFDEEVIMVTVDEVNEPPVIDAIPTQTVDEMTLLTFTAPATDPDLPAQSLVYSLVGEPAGMTIQPSSGQVTWTPTEAQGPGSFTFHVVVSDGQVSDSTSVLVNVQEVNRPPVLDDPSDQSIAETATLSVHLTASDPDLPANSLTYELVSGPSSLTVSPTGHVSWSPTEADGPGVFVVTVRVSDSGSPSLSHEQAFSVTVTETNAAPVLDPISAQLIDEETPFGIQAVASDSDLPAQILTFYVSPGAPSGLTIDPQSGLITWTPSEAQGPGTYPVTVGVQDGLGGTDEVTFSITVREVVKTLSGRVDLQDYSGDLTGQPITIEIRQLGQATALLVRTVNLTSAGTFHFTTSSNLLPAGTYDVAAKGSHWLKRVIPTLSIGASGRSGIDFGATHSLINGDADGDNEVSIGDYALISAAYGTLPGDPNWSASADLDGDLEVSIGDYAILSANYGLTGD